MQGARNGFSRGRGLALGLVCLASCSKAALSDPAVPPACNFALPRYCDVCSTGETVCAHYVVRNGVCVVETCPPAPPLPDASVLPDAPALPDASAVPDVFTADVWMPAVDAATDSSGVGPSYDCGPEGAGLRCNCGPGSYFPAPVNDAGQPQPVVTPDPAAVVAYHTMTEFDVLAVGRWQRTAGMGELICDQFGVEFTADHRLIPLALASDGSVQPVTAQARSFTITFDSAGAPRWLQVAGLQTNPPVFFEGGRSMYFLFSPWPANYVRVP